MKQAGVSHDDIDLFEPHDAYTIMTALTLEASGFARPGEGLACEDLDAYCRGRIASYKIPRYWRLVDSFPMTVTGKVQKFRMREIAVEELGLAGAAAIRTA